MDFVRNGLEQDWICFILPKYFWNAALTTDCVSLPLNDLHLLLRSLVTLAEEYILSHSDWRSYLTKYFKTFWLALQISRLDFQLTLRDLRASPRYLKEKYLGVNPEYSLEGLVAEAEAPVLWPPDWKSRPIGKDPDAGEDWRQKEKGAANWIRLIQWTWIWTDSGRKWKTDEPCVLQSMGLQSQTQLSDWKATNLVC